MSYAIDLTPRQSSRILEQALRHKAGVTLEPRIFNEDEALSGQIEAIIPSGGAANSPSAVVIAMHSTPISDVTQIASAPVTIQELNLLVGTCCDAALRLGDAKYLFDGDVIRVQPAHEPPVIARVFLTRPETLQVMQRRRFSRFRPARSTQVELRWQKDAESLHGTIAWLCNISPDGLACRVERRIGEQLWIGDRITAEFTVAPGELNHYVIESFLCSKTPGGTEDKMILGLQFVGEPGFESSQQATEKLRKHLQARLGTPANLTKGADA